MNGKQIELVIQPLGCKCRVLLDGEDISHLVRKYTVVAEVDEVTTVTLECLKMGGEPFTVSGYLYDEPPKEESGEVVA